MLTIVSYIFDCLFEYASIILGSSLLLHISVHIFSIFVNIMNIYTYTYHIVYSFSNLLCLFVSTFILLLSSFEYKIKTVARRYSQFLFSYFVLAIQNVAVVAIVIITVMIFRYWHFNTNLEKQVYCSFSISNRFSVSFWKWRNFGVFFFSLNFWNTRKWKWKLHEAKLTWWKIYFIYAY